MNEYAFKPGDTAVITASEPRCSTDPPDYSIRSQGVIDTHHLWDGS